MRSAVHALPCQPASIAAVDALLSRFDDPAGPARPVSVPRWDPKLLLDGRAGPSTTVDRLLAGMVGAGQSVATVAFYLGIEESEARERASALGLAPVERVVVRSTHSWSAEDVRRLITLWLDNVSARSIAEMVGRSPGSVHGKRRALGLHVRDRKSVQDRSVAECRLTRIPWLVTTAVIAAVAKVLRPALEPSPREGVKWALGRDPVKDRRFSILGFAGLRAPAIAERMRLEFGVVLTVSAVNNRISRLQIVRDRRDMIDDTDEATVERRAREAMRRLGADLRVCSELNRFFWFCKAIGGPQRTCREFFTKKFRSRQSARAAASVFAM